MSGYYRAIVAFSSVISAASLGTMSYSTVQTNRSNMEFKNMLIGFSDEVVSIIVAEISKNSETE